jgi:hypothetical protein
MVCAAAAWLAAAVMLGAWLAGGRTPVDVTTPVIIVLAPLILRLDAVVVLFGLVVLLPVALLLTFQPRTSGEAAVSALAADVALVTLVAGSVSLTALGLSALAGVVLVLLQQEEGAMTRHYWPVLTGSWLLLAWTAVLFVVSGGTSAYGAVPVSALQVPIFALLAASAVLCAGLLPWRTWVSEAWERRRLGAGVLAVALLVPLGFYPLVRAYGLGAGRWPNGGLNLALGALGAATALAAAIRGQAVTSRRGLLAEAVPLGSGLVLLALSLGTAVGVVAALIGLLGLGLAAGLAPLVPDRPGFLSVLAMAVVLSVPPTLGFGGWLLAVQAAVEAGQATAFLGLAGAAAWFLGLAATARASRLPAAPPGASGEGSRPGSVVGSVFAMGAGVGLTGLIVLLAVPAASEVMPPAAGRGIQPGLSPAAILSAGSLGVSTAAGGWAAALLGGPLVLLGVVAATAVRAARARAGRARRAELGLVEGRGPAPAGTAAEPVQVAAPLSALEPLFEPPLAGLAARCAELVTAASLPEQYRSLFQPAVLERAAGRARPWFWLVATAALAVAVTR